MSDQKTDPTLTEKLQQKTKEADALDKANASLAEENNVPVEDALPKGEKMLAAIGYISLLCLLPLLLKPKSDFCQFHGKQGLVLFIFALIVSVIGRWFSYGSWWWFGELLRIIIFAIAIYGIIQAVKGLKKKIPLVGDMAKELNW